MSDSSMTLSNPRALALRDPWAMVPSLGNLDAYISAVNRLPLLTQEEEVELARKLRDEGDLQAAGRLVLSHLRLVVSLSRQYLGYGLPQGDLIQEGNVGLMKAVKRYDPEQGVRLVSYAMHWIKAEIHEYILKNWRLVKVATTKAQRKLFFNLRKYKRNLGWLSAEETQAVARDLGVSTQDVTEMERRLSSRDVSYDPSPDADEEEESYSPAAYLPAPDADPAIAVEREEWDEDVSEKVTAAMSELDERSRDILRSRWMDEPKATLHDLADRYGVSAERIRQIEANAIKKLQKLVTA